MLGTRVSHFIKKRYVVQPQNSVPSSSSELKIDPETEALVPAPDQVKVRPELPEQPELVVERVPEPEPATPRDPVLSEYDNSKLGRAFGWWVCIDGQRVASLEYCCLLEELVHLYSVNVLDDKFLLIDLDPVKWLGTNVTIQSRYAEGYIRPGLSMAAVGRSMIVVENLSIPEEYFRRRHHELEEFQQTLVEKAKSKSR